MSLRLQKSTSSTTVWIDGVSVVCRFINHKSRANTLFNILNKYMQSISEKEKEIDRLCWVIQKREEEIMEIRSSMCSTNYSLRDDIDARNYH